MAAGLFDYAIVQLKLLLFGERVLLGEGRGLLFGVGYHFHGDAVWRAGY